MPLKYGRYMLQLRLHNRPPTFIKHCLKRLPPAVTVLPDTAMEVHDCSFLVGSETVADKRYCVYLKSTEIITAPACECADWRNYCSAFFPFNWCTLRKMYGNSFTMLFRYVCISYTLTNLLAHFKFYFITPDFTFDASIYKLNLNNHSVVIIILTF